LHGGLLEHECANVAARIGKGERFGSPPADPGNVHQMCGGGKAKPRERAQRRRAVARVVRVEERSADDRSCSEPPRDTRA